MSMTPGERLAQQGAAKWELAALRSRMQLEQVQSGGGSSEDPEGGGCGCLLVVILLVVGGIIGYQMWHHKHGHNSGLTTVTATTPPAKHQASDPRSESAFSAGTLPDTGLRPHGPHTCPAPGPTVIPGAQPGVRCRWVVHLDLDGNGVRDEVVLWRSDHARGAVAVTDRGKILQLQATPTHEKSQLPTADWRTTDLGPVDEFPGSTDSATPMKIIRASGGREVLAIDSYDGALNPDVWLLGMDTAGHLAFVADSSDFTAAYTQAGLNNSQGGCAIDRIVFTPPMHVSC
jgi:hypothetical protein